ncbi:efflux RND transporter periplasmic adaptor subunit [Aliidiomarina sp. Khilg15.8]
MSSRQLPLFALLLGLLSACSPATQDNTDTPPRPVKLFTVDDQRDAATRRFPAVVEATQTASLAFRVAGEITELPFRPGQQVSANQQVAALDARDYELAVEQAAARAELVESQHRRNQRLLEQELISQAQFDQSRADQRVAQAELDVARTNLEYTRLRAPFAGVVANLHVDKHENIAPQQAIMTLQADALIDVSIQVPERLFAQVRRDLEYQPDVLFDGLPGRYFKASVREWNRVADAATNTYRVVFTLPAPGDVHILPGMTATVLIDTEKMTSRAPNVVMLPAAAVFAPEEQPLRADTAYVWLYQADDEHSAGTVSLHQVAVGDMTNDGVQITDGLTPGDQVVEAGVHHLRDGQAVKPWVRERGL